MTIPPESADADTPRAGVDSFDGFSCSMNDELDRIWL